MPITTGLVLNIINIILNTVHVKLKDDKKSKNERLKKIRNKDVK